MGYSKDRNIDINLFQNKISEQSSRFYKILIFFIILLFSGIFFYIYLVISSDYKDFEKSFNIKFEEKTRDLTERIAFSDMKMIFFNEQFIQLSKDLDYFNSKSKANKNYISEQHSINDRVSYINIILGRYRFKNAIQQIIVFPTKIGSVNGYIMDLSSSKISSISMDQVAKYENNSFFKLSYSDKVVFIGNRNNLMRQYSEEINAIPKPNDLLEYTVGMVENIKLKIFIVLVFALAIFSIAIYAIKLYSDYLVKKLTSFANNVVDLRNEILEKLKNDSYALNQQELTLKHDYEKKKIELDSEVKEKLKYLQHEIRTNSGAITMAITNIDRLLPTGLDTEIFEQLIKIYALEKCKVLAEDYARNDKKQLYYPDSFKSELFFNFFNHESKQVLDNKMKRLIDFNFQEPTSKCRLSCFEGELSSIVFRLIGNAIKHTPDACLFTSGKAIYVNIFDENGSAVIVVGNNVFKKSDRKEDLDIALENKEKNIHKIKMAADDLGIEFNYRISQSGIGGIDILEARLILKGDI